jgi:hypothetical protein
LLNGFNGVSVDKGDGSFVVEMLKHDKLIGFNCTTHLEAFVLGKDSVFLDFGQPVLESTLVERYFSKVNIREFLASGISLVSVVDRKQDLREVLLLPGIFDRWRSFVTKNVASGGLDLSYFEKPFDGLNQNVHPDIARRRAVIAREEVELVFDLIAAEHKNLVGARILSNDSIVIGPR